MVAHAQLSTYSGLGCCINESNFCALVHRSFLPGRWPGTLPHGLKLTPTCLHIKGLKYALIARNLKNKKIRKKKLLRVNFCGVV
jgi:hypothetical protein